MKKAVLSMLGVLTVATSAFAQSEIVTRETLTGRENVVQGTVMPCSVPETFPLIIMSAHSSFQYGACREYTSAEYSVSGSHWNKDYAEIPGTRKTFMRFERVNKSFSENVPSAESESMRMVYYGIAASAAYNSCLSFRQQIENLSFRSNVDPNCRSSGQ